MSSDQYEAAMEGFVAELNRAHHAAGRPTYSELQRVSEHLRGRGGADRVDVLTRSNTNEILNGRRQRPPHWQWVKSFLIVLRTIAKNNAIATEPIGTDAGWKRRHDAVFAAAEAAAKRPVTVGRHRKPTGHAGPGSIAPGTAIVPAQSSAAAEPEGAKVGAMLAEPFQSRWHAGGPRWWQRYRDIAPQWLDAYLCLESAAKVVRTYEPRVLPGLLQAESYARDVLRQYCPGADEAEIARLVELRMERHRHLDNPRFQVWAIVGEPALRNPAIDVRGLRLQIAHLINVCEQPNVTMQILRLPQQPELDDQLAIREPITQFRFPDEHHDDVVFLERPNCGVIMTNRVEIAHYSRLLSRLGLRAASAHKTHDLLCQIFAEL